jgi:hypothetical protein
MIKNKNTLLAGIIIMMIQVVWTPTLWSMIESGGLHWWFIRLPLLLSMPIGVGLFLSSIENRTAHREGSSSALQAGNFELANDILEGAIESNPKDAVLYRSKAIALMFAGRDPEAKVCIDQSLRMDKDDQLTQCIAEILDDVANGKRSRPRSMKEI